MYFNPVGWINGVRYTINGMRLTHQISYLVIVSC